MATYQTLDINQRINLKPLAKAWMDITIERFQREELDKKVYSDPQRQNGRSRRKPKRTPRRSRQLRANWTSTFTPGGQSGGRILMSFLLYGRFVDMGVGKGVDYAEATYRRSRRNGEKITRRAKRWYSRRKGFETHRLRELLSRHYINISLDSLETMLTDSVSISL